MELRQLQTFQAVVRGGSFLRAAADLGYAQSTVTLHVQQLETSLGVLLFARQGKRVRLTEAGRALTEHADDLLGRVDALRRSMADFAAGDAGHVRAGAIEPAATLRLSPLLARFCAARPRLRLTLEVGGTRSLSEQVAAGDLDVAIASPPPVHLALTFERLFVEAMALLVPSRHPLATAPDVRPADLTGHRVLLTERVCAYRAETERVLLAHGADPYSGIEIGSMGALKRGVQDGLGVGILPRAIVTPPPPATVVRDLAGVDIGLPVGIVRRPERGPDGPALAAFIQALRDELRPT
jgi:DNA-binding transcriptional LysR family regulator